MRHITVAVSEENPTKTATTSKSLFYYFMDLLKRKLMNLFDDKMTTKKNKKINCLNIHLLIIGLKKYLEKQM